MESSTIDAIAEYLNKDSESRGISAQVLRDSIRSEGGWLYVPVRIPSISDAYEIAVLLQEMEDGWNLAEPRPVIQISLIPAGRAGGSGAREANDAYRAAYERQMRALEGVVKHPERLSNHDSQEFQEAKEAYDQAVKVLEHVGPRDWPV